MGTCTGAGRVHTRWHDGAADSEACLAASKPRGWQTRKMQSNAAATGRAARPPGVVKQTRAAPGPSKVRGDARVGAHMRECGRPTGAPSALRAPHGATTHHSGCCHFRGHPMSCGMRLPHGQNIAQHAAQAAGMGCGRPMGCDGAMHCAHLAGSGDVFTPKVAITAWASPHKLQELRGLERARGRGRAPALARTI